MNIRVDRTPLLARHVRKLNWMATNRNRKPPMKVKSTRFDSFVARYYPAVYNFASRLTDDPRVAELLTHDAFMSIRKQLRNRRQVSDLAFILECAVCRAGLTTA